MGTMRSFQQANPNYGYSFKSLLMRAVAADYDFLESLAENSTSVKALKNLRKVALIMDHGYSDSISDYGNHLRYTISKTLKTLKTQKLLNL